LVGGGAGEAKFACLKEGLGGTGGRENRRERELESGEFGAEDIDAAGEEGAAADLQGNGAGGGEGGRAGVAGGGEGGVRGLEEDASARVEPDGVGVEDEALVGELLVKIGFGEGGEAKASVGDDAELEGEGGGKAEPERPAKETSEQPKKAWRALGHGGV
jgi:hypothetical protein